MASGGARNRSGPQADPRSARSERRGLKLTALPAEGWSGDAPDFPLPRRTVFYVDGVGKDAVRMVDEAETARVAAREREIWCEAWTFPQAAAWAQPSERWRWPTIALWVRTYVLCESSEATAADKGSLHRFADQIGLTPAGLKENGWAVAHDEVAARRADQEPAAVPPSRRMRAVAGGS